MNSMINKFWCLFLTAVLTSSISTAQLSKNWYNEDPSQEKFAGVSSDRAYDELLKSKTSTPVIVAVIDGGTDIEHPDLVGQLWTNEKEIADNGIDDDNNGYVDDVHGWSFIGGKTGDVQYENLEATRIYRRLQPEYEGKAAYGLNSAQKAEFENYQKAKTYVESELKTAKAQLAEYTELKGQLDELKLAMGDDDFTAEEVAKYQTSDTKLNELKTAIASAMTSGVPFSEIYNEMEEGYKYYYTTVNYHLNVNYNPRDIVGDHPANSSEKNYGNNHVTGPDALHGTHVAGIIGAQRDNTIGIKGVAGNVHLMIVRVVPDGDERDKDVANAIRYATDNGARVINMSFGKSFTSDKKAVLDAISYAASKDVLLVHASGNDAANIDKDPNFPYPFYESGKREPAWLEVGAISSSGDVASFSNYGPKTVDILAPGVSIYSTLPGNTYGNENGTSMAAPVVSGIAALIRQYYPDLSAVQVRQIIMDSAIKIKSKTILPGSKKKKVKYSKLCSSAGIASAYRALKLAGGTSGKSN